MKWLDYYLQKLRFKAATNYVPPNSRLLDIGCNQGEFFVFLNEKNITGTGVDPEVEFYNLKLPAGVKLIKDQFPSEMLMGEQFDCITALAVFEHIPEINQAVFLDSCSRFLSSNGKMIITVPSPLVDLIIHVLRFIRIVDAMNIGQHHGFKPGQVIPLFCKAGFKLLHHKKFELGLNHVFVFEKKNL